jgi:hypothetical protein
MLDLVSHKVTMLSALQRGVFGNHFDWMPYEQWLKSEHDPEHVHSARFGMHLGAPWIYNVSASDLIESVTASPCPRDCVTVASKPVVTPLLNAEVQRTAVGLDLTYSTYNAVMRESLAKGLQVATGLKAKCILEHYCDPASVSDIQELLDVWPGAVVEFTVFDRDCGVMPHRSTIIWEVRRY